MRTSLERKAGRAWRIVGKTAYQHGPVGIYDIIVLLSDCPWITEIVFKNGVARQVGKKWGKAVKALNKLNIKVIVGGEIVGCDTDRVCRNR